MKLFSLGETEIRCSPILLIMLPIAVVLGSIRLVIVAFMSLCVHEAAHAMAAYRLGYKVSSLEIMPFGFVARLDLKDASAGDAAAIFAAGPVASLALAAISSLMESLVPVYREADLGLTEFNLLIAAVNLLPALPLDGGRLLSAAVSGRGRRTAHAVLRASGVLTGAAFLALFVLLLFNSEVNPTFLIMGVFLVIAALKERQAPSVIPSRVRRERALPVRSVAVTSDTGVLRAVGLLPTGGYSVVSVVDGNGRRIAELDGNSLIEALTVLGSEATVKEAVALYGRRVL